MSPDRLKLIYKLLLTKKAFIDKRVSMTGKKRYCIYLDKAMPFAFVSKSEFNYIQSILLEKDGVYVISRSKIRECHGKSTLKSVYLDVLKTKSQTSQNKTHEPVN